ncbi:methyltransferase domain-containing protein [Streptomyces sp. NPDC020719]|uniref:methyltransferase domain-containing protein n=1 Tax=Streptomyces sp. NPDC020719 TaxID=3154896 RepID=UPI0033DFDF50
MTDPDYTSLRQQLTELLAEQGAFRAEWTRPIFERVPRHLFAPDTVYVWHDERWQPLRQADDPDRWASIVYHLTDAVVTQVDDGHPAKDGSGLVPTSSISCVAAVLNMVTSLDPRPGDATLEIGAGSGYNAAILAERCGEQHVVTMEIDPTLASGARENLARANYAPTVVCGDGEQGYPDRAPYNRLVSTASVRRVPAKWLEQMGPDGEIVAPWLPNERGLGLIWLRMREPGVARGWFHGAETFMAVRGQRQERADLAGIWNATHEGAEETQERHDLGDVNVHGEFALGAILPGVTTYRQDGGWFFLAQDRKSWARINGTTVERYGTRDLIRDAADALQWWRAKDRPRLYDFGITATRDEQTLWLEDPATPVPMFGA